jgi:tripartite-type tricarboxylate transporter receptor subunit TctC
LAGADVAPYNCCIFCKSDGRVQSTVSTVPPCRVGPHRAEVLPDVPTVGEVVPGYEVSVWNGLGAPKGTPAEIVEKLNREIRIVLAEPTIKTRLADLGYSMFPSSAAEFGEHIAGETEKWGKVIRAANIKPE